MNLVDHQQQTDSLSGLILASSAFSLWGILPFLMKTVAHIPTLEVIAHRVLWSLPVVGVILILTRRTSDVRAALKSPKTLGMAIICSTLISCNWGIYVWSVGAGKTIQASMGYYISPLVAILLGTVVLGEKLSGGQKISSLIAAMAVAVLAWDLGAVPWVALSLTGSWSVYAFLRKTLPIGANQGFMLEVMILFLPSLGIVFWFALNGQGHFGSTGYWDTLLLIFCGVATAIPLMLFTNATKRIRMSSIGILQFITPTLMFIIAVFAFNEPFSFTKLVAFIMIWVAMVIFGYTIIRKGKNERVYQDKTGTVI